MFIILILLLFQSCDDKENEPGIIVEFVETQCSNPWSALPGSDNYLFEVHQYLNNADIEIFSISIENVNGSGIHCNACNCPSGRKIIIRIAEKDIKKAENIGFY